MQKPRVNTRRGMPLALGTALAIGTAVWSYETQPTHFCVQPQEPITNERILAAYDISLSAEYSRYFDEANAYLGCLQRSQTDVRDQIQRHLADFQALRD